MALTQPNVPRATYRLQLHAGFGFAEASAIVPYLARLGISHLYASPITMARPGSTHGYDVIDFNRLDPELGDDAAFDALIAALHAHEMGLLLDFVPNHMGVGSDNPWWLDVLEWGQDSPYATFFDIDWEANVRGGVRGKVTLPVLGDQYGKVLEAGELRLQIDHASGTFHVAYHDERFPIAVRRYPQLLHAAANLLDREGAALFALANRFAVLCENEASAEQWAVRRQGAFALKEALAEIATDALLRDALDAGVAALNGTAGLPETFQPLHELLEDQAYRLAYWRVASTEINYRRFFDINQLAGLHMEHGEVFEATHRLLLRLIAEGKVKGVRLDHIDGMYDPRGYCRRLLARVADVLAQPGNEQSLADPRRGQPIYLLVEKILARHESLRDDLPVAGTTGYEFLNLVNGLFVDPAAERAMTRTYHRFIDREPDYDEMLLEAKQQTLRYSLNSELHVLGHELHRLAQQSWTTRDFTLTGLREALSDIIVRFPVYRTYITGDSVAPEDRRDLDWATGRARKETALIDHSVLDFVYAALSTDLVGIRGYRRSDVIAAAMHFQQLTSPVMAKSLEDTTFYRYNRLVSLNEVGGEPNHFGVSPTAFHHLLLQQQRHHPASMLASATHDHKRGEDVRARLDALSELPQEWRRQVGRWARLNRSKRRELEGQRVPGRNDEYLLYQTLVGAWPQDLTAEDALGLAAFGERIASYMIKACREAKLRTSWTAPDADYEAGLERFVQRILDPREGRAFMADLLAFQARIGLIGAVNGLAQTLIKLTAPGVPDIYQGCELWDLSLVDPDNRRPVDFALRGRMLGQAGDPAALLAGWRDGRIKQHVIHRTLALRRAQPTLFEDSYTPLDATGLHADRIIAFARTSETATLITIVPRLIEPLLNGSELPLPPAAAWGDTRIALPAELPGASLHNPLTGAEIEPPAEGLAAAEVLADLPVALLTTIRPGG